MTISRSTKSIVSPVNSASAPARLSALPIVTRSQKRWCVLLGALFAFDVVDIYAFSYVAPAITAEWGLSLHSVGVVTSATFLGMFLGGVVGGHICDRFGRKRTLVGSVLMYSALSLTTAFAPSIEFIVVARFFTGFGLLAMTSALIVYVAEMYPRNSRGRYQSMLLAIGLVGVPMTAWLSRLVISLGPDMWRWIFVFGALGAVAGIAAIWLLPESVRWQSLRGDDEAASATVARLERQAIARTGQPLPDPVAEPTIESGRIGELLRGRNLRNFVVLSVGSVLIQIAFFGYNAYVPTLLADSGYTTSQTMVFASIFSIAAVPGALLAWPTVDRFERKLLIAATTVVLGGLFVTFGVTTIPGVLLASGFLITMLLQSVTVFQYAYLPEMFPTHLRGVGSGVANGLGRLGVFFGGFVFASMVTELGFAGYFIVMAAFLILGGATLGIFGMRTTNRPLVENAAAADVHIREEPA